MEWVALFLLLGLCVVSWLWWLSIRQMNSFTNFFLLTLLSEENYRKHRGSLLSRISDVKADNAIELSLKITFMVRKLVGNADPDRMAAVVASSLWDRKMQPAQQN